MKRLTYVLVALLLTACSQNEPFVDLPVQVDSQTDTDTDSQTDNDTQVPENIFNGDVLLETQAEVEEFGSNQYTEIVGRIYIRNNEVLDLTPLNTLTKVNNITVVQTAITTLDGLENITETGSLNITSNFNLENLDALNLVSINAATSSVDFYSTWIRFNYNLTSIEGLSSLTSTFDLLIEGNSNLTSLDGLENLSEITGEFIAEGIGVRIGGQAGIDPNFERGNVALVDLCSLTNLLSSDDFDPVNYHAERNAHNPTFEDIIDGNCDL